MFRYETPAGVDDLAGRPTRQTFLNDWHNFIEKEFRDNIGGLKNPVDGSGNFFDTPIPDPLFFTEVDDVATSADIPIGWNAFPLSISRRFPNNQPGAWQQADQLLQRNRATPSGVPAPILTRPQDEYCEWYAYRNTAGQLTRLVFTAEAPEYWVRLAKHDFARVVELYRAHVSPSVQDADIRLSRDIFFGGELLSAGSYNPYNRWNTTDGVMHLTHTANTLGAEINLAARATIPRRATDGSRITDVRKLACSSNFGDPNRSSDPNIGNAANLTAVPTAGAPLSVTLANPVALYLSRLRPGVLTDTNGQPLDHWFTFVRGASGKGLMAVLAPPAGSTFGLDQVLVGGIPLQRGGQVAEHIDMVLYAKTANLSKPATALADAVQCCCVPAGTPTSQLPRLNFGAVPKPQSCADIGQAAAFQECDTPPSPALTSARGVPARPDHHRTRNADE
jgi:hypothetical protein